MLKIILRQKLIEKRSALLREEWITASEKAQKNLTGLDVFKNARCVALYAPVRNETDTMIVFADAFAQGKRVLYPVVNGSEMILRQVTSMGMMSPGRFGIPEPNCTGEDHDATEPDIIVVPGVAFDTAGRRIGFGRAYYDRFLTNPGRKAALVGLCHDFQLVGESIPAEPHDIQMDMIVTDKRVVRCGGNRVS